MKGRRWAGTAGAATAGLRQVARGRTEMEHGRARAPSRQTMRVAPNVVGRGYPPVNGGRLFCML